MVAGISYVRFERLARLADSSGQATMTELADGADCSRSGLAHQAVLITRGPSVEDQRATVVTPPRKAGLIAKVLPGHIEVARRLLFDPLSARDPEEPVRGRNFHSDILRLVAIRIHCEIAAPPP